MGMDISNMYLNTPLDRFEYMRIYISKIPQEIIDEYNLMDLVEPDGCVYIEIQHAMYGLHQSGRLTNNELEEVLGAQGYYPSKYTLVLYYVYGLELALQVEGKDGQLLVWRYGIIMVKRY